MSGIRPMPGMFPPLFGYAGVIVGDIMAGFRPLAFIRMYDSYFFKNSLLGSSKLLAKYSWSRSRGKNSSGTT
jgi:hypothetical protein